MPKNSEESMNINPNNGDIFRQFKTIANQPVNSFQPAQTSSIQTKSEPKKK